MFTCARHHSKACIKYELMGEGRDGILCKLMRKDSGKIVLEWNHRMRKQVMRIRGPLGGVEVSYNEHSRGRKEPHKHRASKVGADEMREVPGSGESELGFHPEWSGCREMDHDLIYCLKSRSGDDKSIEKVL